MTVTRRRSARYAGAGRCTGQTIVAVEHRRQKVTGCLGIASKMEGDPFSAGWEDKRAANNYLVNISISILLLVQVSAMESNITELNHFIVQPSCWQPGSKYRRNYEPAGHDRRKPETNSCHHEVRERLSYLLARWRPRRRTLRPA